MACGQHLKSFANISARCRGQTVQQPVSVRLCVWSEDKNWLLWDKRAIGKEFT